MRPSVLTEPSRTTLTLETSYASSSKPSQPSKQNIRRRGDHPKATANTINMHPPPSKIERPPHLPIHCGSIFRWRPSQSLGFQVASVTAKTASGYRHHSSSSRETSSSSGFGSTSISSASSFLSDNYSSNSLSTFPSKWTLSGGQQHQSTTVSGGKHSSLFVISKIDPWGPMAIFAPQLKVGMRIVAINHQPCPKTQEGLQALLEAAPSPPPHSDSSSLAAGSEQPVVPPPASSKTMANNNNNKAPTNDGAAAAAEDDNEKTGWITIHAVDLQEELKQREYYLHLNSERGMDPDEQRTESSSYFSEETSLLPVELREEVANDEGIIEDEGIKNMIQVEIVAKELLLNKPSVLLEEEEKELDENHPELRQQLKALHFLEEKRQRAIAYEAKEHKKLKRAEKKEWRRLRAERYMAQNVIWDMKIKTQPATSAGGKDSAALENFSILAAAETKKKDDPKQAKIQAKKERKRRERMAEAKALDAIEKKLREIEQGETDTAQTSTVGETRTENDTVSDGGIFPALVDLLFFPPTKSSSPARKHNKERSATSSRSSLSTIEEQQESMQSTISSKTSLGWHNGWGLVPSKHDSKIIENTPNTLQTTPFISPQRWSCEPSIETESETLSLFKLPSGAKNKKKKTENLNDIIQEQKSKKRDPEPYSSNDSKKDPEGAFKGIRAPFESPNELSKQTQQQQLRKLSKPPKKGPALPAAKNGEYRDSLLSKKKADDEKTGRASIGQLRQLVAHLEKNGQIPPKQQPRRSPPGNTSQVTKPPVPFPEQPRRKKKPSNHLIPASIPVPSPSCASSVSMLDDGAAATTIPKKKQKKKEPKTKRKAVAVATGNTTTTAFTLPKSRITPADEKKKQMKKLQANWKAARLRNALEAKLAAQEETEEARKYRDWSLSSLFFSVFFCGDEMDAMKEENDLLVE